MKWREVIFGHPMNNLFKKKLHIDLKWIEKCDQKRFSIIQNIRRWPFCKKGRWEPFYGWLATLLISFVIWVLSLTPTMNRSRIYSGPDHRTRISNLVDDITTPGLPTSYVFSLNTPKFIKLHSFILCSVIIVFLFVFCDGSSLMSVPLYDMVFFLILTLT